MCTFTLTFNTTTQNKVQLQILENDKLDMKLVLKDDRNKKFAPPGRVVK